MNCWGKFFTSKVAVNCKTEEEIKSFFQECKNLESSITLISGRPLDAFDDFQIYETEICFIYETLPKEKQLTDNDLVGISITNIKWAKDHNYEIVGYN
ncbi:hypothetical protein M5L40_003597 [Clostridium botulinum]|nr:hypothetical protein [Clostridium botulinum]